MVIRIAVDNQISNRTINQLNLSGFNVVQKAENMPDEMWLDLALRKGAEFIISPDLDIPNLLDRWDAPAIWIDVKQGLRGYQQPGIILRSLKETLARLNNTR